MSGEISVTRLNRELKAVTRCLQTLLRSENEPWLLSEICRIVCEEAGYRMAWVGYCQDDAHKSVRAVAWGGTEEGYLARSGITWADTERGRGPVGTAVRTGQTAYMQDFAVDPQAAPWREMALERGYRAGIALPLRDEYQRPFGVLAIYSTQPDSFTLDEVRLLEDMAANLAFGIASLRARVVNKRLAEELRQNETRLRTVMQTIPDLVWLKDLSGAYLACNRQVERLFGMSEAQIVGRTDYDFFPRELADFFRDHDRRAIASPGKPCVNEEWLTFAEGGYRGLFETVKTTMRDHTGTPTGVVGIARDITERHKAEEQRRQLAYYDPLTQLPNRRLLMDRLEQALNDITQGPATSALLFIDLDHFKLLNDTIGHEIGDRLLCSVAARLTSSVREGDTIARLGGDEFVVILANLGQRSLDAATEARKLGEHILEVLNRPYTIGKRVLHSTPSIGVALFSAAGGSVDELIKQADIAMYQAKAAGRNTLRFFDPHMQAALAARASLEAELRFAIYRHEFVLHYQPQVHGVRGIIGAEALIRWQHPERGTILPREFIPLAEETGLILEIGQWVLEAACRQLSDWHTNRSSHGLYLAINVSARQFRQADFVAQVDRALERAGAPAGRLKIELTETLVLDDIEDTIQKMQALQELGVGFCMDDFGTGYSSLSYLTRLPLDQIKIDQSFVSHLPHSGNDAIVVQTIITMARSLGLTAIAEGVETEAQREFLEHNGCLACQGYLFSAPVPLAEFEELLLVSQ